MKPIHKAIKKIQGLHNENITENHYPVFVDDDRYFCALNINKVSATNDYLAFLKGQTAGLVPSELIRQMDSL